MRSGGGPMAVRGGRSGWPSGGAQRAPVPLRAAAANDGSLRSSARAVPEGPLHPPCGDLRCPICSATGRPRRVFADDPCCEPCGGNADFRVGDLGSIRSAITGRTVALRDLLEDLRREGFPSPDEDEVVAIARELTSLPRAAALSAAVTEANVPAQPGLGIAGGTFPRTRPATPEGRAACGPTGAGCGFQEETRGKIGSYAQMLADIRAMGGGRVRRNGQCDTTYAALFPVNETAGNLYAYGAQVPSPPDLRTAMRGTGPGPGRYGRFSATWWLLIAAITQGVKVDLTAFNAGGGTPLNFAPQDDPDAAIPLDDTRNSTVTWSQLQPGAPPWQDGFMVPSGYGWSPLYWDHTTLGRSDSRELYQAFVLNLYPTTSGSGTPYDQECARRKCLALSAYAQELASWLVWVDQRLRARGLGTIYDVVEVIDVGNELEQYWAIPGGGASAATVTEGAMEVGRYVALLAGPIRSALPSMKFRLELASWFSVGGAPPGGDHASKVAWLEEVITTGIPAEVERWHRLAAQRRILRGGGAVSVEAAEWFASEAAVGEVWPPLADLPRSGGLLQQIGMHWYHVYNRDSTGREDWGNYADAEQTTTDLGLLVDLAARLSDRFRLAVVVGEVGVAAVDPGPMPDGAGAWTYYYANTSGELQAGMYLRTVSLLHALGAEFTTLWTFTHGTPTSASLWPDAAFSTWGIFTTDGVHNDVEYKPGPGYADYAQAVDCWPRPAWFTIRRFAWLMYHVRSGTGGGFRLAWNSGGVTVVELTFGLLPSATPDGTATLPAPTRAWVAWIDQTAAVGGATLRLLLDDPVPAWSLLPMVPVVRPPVAGLCEGGTAAVPDPNGYATPCDVDWEAGSDLSCVRAAVVIPGGYRYSTTLGRLGTLTRVPDELMVSIIRCDPDGATALAPVCLLARATFVEVV